MKQKPPTIRQFLVQFPTDDACLDHLMRVRYGDRFACSKCGREAHYYRVKTRRCYECEFCANQIYPTAGTPFEKTRTSLKDWYYVMFLFCATRNGVSSKEVQRQLGVTYKTAWRMTHEIRKYMGAVDGDFPMGGSDDGEPVVEIDKTFIGGKHPRKANKRKAVVLGMVERGGDVISKVVRDRSKKSVLPHIKEWVEEGSRVATDEAKAFADLHEDGYQHATVNHTEKEYVRGDVHTNTIESYWSAVKRTIKGTYVWVSKKHLQKYLWECEYRHNLRRSPHLMFDVLLASFPKPAAFPAPSH
ncbi:MAG: IS1595 family transposase [Alphaproteobacteria bacterium]|nr:IS1595 family transposase [Alphaproteobacteria bacterium]